MFDNNQQRKLISNGWNHLNQEQVCYIAVNTTWESNLKND